MSKLVHLLRLGRNRALIGQLVVREPQWPSVDTGRWASNSAAKSDKFAKHHQGKTAGSKEQQEKITLHGLDDSISVTTLADAQKLAKRRDLKIVKETEFDGKSQRPVYRYNNKKRVQILHSRLYYMFSDSPQSPSSSRTYYENRRTHSPHQIRKG